MTAPWKLTTAFLLGISIFALTSSPTMARDKSSEKCAALKKRIDSRRLTMLREELKDTAPLYVDRIRIYKDGCLLASADFQRDYRAIYRGTDTPENEYDYRSPVLHPYYRGSELHTLQSVTKSITSLVFAVALERGDMPSLDQPATSYFDAATLKNADERKSRILIRHLLDMTSGIDWRDDPDTDDMEQRTFDWAQFTIDKPMAAEPGSRFLYSNGETMILSHILQKQTGMTVAEYARQHLFEPLGIEDFHWKHAPNGLTDTEGGLYLKPDDLAKIGQLVLNEGEWNGARLFSSDYLDMSNGVETRRKGRRYTRQWWIPASPCNTPIFAANGFGGQLLLVFPETGTVAVFNAWSIFEADISLIHKIFIAEAMRMTKRDFPKCSEREIADYLQYGA
jgi:CubicO group peptidase (beta-lactamase class C family)